MVMTTFLWLCAGSVPNDGVTVIPAIPWLLAIQVMVFGLLLLNVTVQLLQLLENAAGETEKPPDRFGCKDGAAATGEGRASKGTRSASRHRKARAMNADRRENPVELRGNIA
jgi:hypothetical protein